jgi:alpha-L-rhamnosidase
MILGISDHDGPDAGSHAARIAKRRFKPPSSVKTAFCQRTHRLLVPWRWLFELLPDSLQPAVVKQLLSLIYETGDHLATGFLGTAYIMQALSDHGQTHLAYTLLEQETMPSWLYMVKQGATTLWEEWDAKKPNGDLRECSFNLSAYGVVGNWLYTTVAGIRALSPGYQNILIEPHPGGGLTWAKASYDCNYGKIVSAWKIADGKFNLHAEVPPGTTATIKLPDGQSKEVGQGSYDFRSNLK